MNRFAYNEQFFHNIDFLLLRTVRLPHILIQFGIFDKSHLVENDVKIKHY